MKPKRFFGYPGGKYRFAARYPKPQYDTIVEPFAGGAGYSLHYHEREVILVERDPDVTALWRYLIAADGDDIAALPLWDGSWDDVRELVHLSHPERLLIGSWLNAGNFRSYKPSKWMRTNDPTTMYWRADLRETLAKQVHLINHWRIIEGGYSSAPDVVASWFIDPPYQVAGERLYRFGSGLLDFEALGLWCQRRPGQITVCEDSAATWLPFKPLIDTPAVNLVRRVESIWYEETM